MQKITYLCDGCGKEDLAPLNLFEVKYGVLEIRLNTEPSAVDAHVCSRDCAKLVGEQWGIDRTTPLRNGTPGRVTECASDRPANCESRTNGRPIFKAS